MDVAGVEQIYRPEMPQVERVAVHDGVVGFWRLCFLIFTDAMDELPTVTRAMEGNGAVKSGYQAADGVQQWQEAKAQ